MAEHGEHDDGGHGKKGHGKHGGHGGHGGGHGEEEGGAPEWLISFADMVMLMMGFFVIMFALNVQPKGGNPGGGGEEEEGVANEPDIVDFAISVRRAFHTLDNLDPDNPEDRKLLERLQEYAGAGQSRDDGTKGNDADVKTPRETDHFGKGTMVAFALRSTQVDEAAAATILEFATKQKGRNAVIEVRGHTGISESFKRKREAMDMSYDRAIAVAEALVADGIDWARIRVKVVGDSERVDPEARSANADGRNARVEMLVTDEVVSRAPAKPVGGGGASESRAPTARTTEPEPAAPPAEEP